MSDNSETFGPADSATSQISESPRTGTNEDPISGGSGISNNASASNKAKISAVERQLHRHTMKRLRHGHRMVIALASFMALIVALFFGMAIAADHIFLSFLCNDAEVHNKLISYAGQSSSFPVELVTIVPAVSSALLGLLVLITLVRFIANYASMDSKKKEKEEASSNAISDFFHQLIKFIKDSKSS